jgi:hypothetical protein
MLDNCVTAINKTVFFITKGSARQEDFDQTYFFNIKTSTLTPGPAMIQPRIDPMCSRIRNPESGIYDKIVMAGGLDQDMSPIKSTEILDLFALIWKPGPDLPVGLFSGVMVEHYDGGVVIVGGGDSFVMARYEMYHLPTVSDSWNLMNQKLFSARFYPTAILVHESFANCTQ